MSAELGDLLQLVDNQTYLGQQVLNVYYYRVVSIAPLADGYLETINDNWESTVLENVIGIQVQGVVHQTREWKNLTNALDLYVDSTAVNGQISAAADLFTPSFVSAGFQLVRESLATRSGYKRFVGLPDSYIDGNSYTGPLGLISDVSGALSADLFAGLALVAEPVIVQRPIEPPVSSYVYSSIGSARFRGIGTQNTRKAGRGV